jgi:hypothetical protein
MNTNIQYNINYLAKITGAVTAVLLMAAGTWLFMASPVRAESSKPGGKHMNTGHTGELAPYAGYLKAHQKVQHPLQLLGGPLEVKVTQKVGGVHVSLPDFRRLDPDVFGTPEHPRAFGGTPMIDGVPLPLRKVQDGRYTKVAHLSPFGDKAIVMGKGNLQMDVVDATATDAATSRDSVHFTASWQDKNGNVYGVRCCRRLAVHGTEYPTFGGVVTNGLMHGSSRVGTSLMPTLYDYAAFWGMGEVLKNGKVIDSPRLVHVMLTEYVRTKGYALAFDDQVTPERVHLHLMVPPMMPNMKQGGFTPDPVKTGFTLANGKPLPFWHVMFQNISVRARHLDNGWVRFPQTAAK